VVTEKYYTDLLRKTLLKKGYSSNSFPKTSVFKITIPPQCGGIVIFILKSLDRGSGDNLSSERYPPINSYNMLLYGYQP